MYSPQKSIPAAPKVDIADTVILVASTGVILNVVKLFLAAPAHNDRPPNVALRKPMQCVNLTDDELWRRIAQNTTLMSVLVYRLIELDAGNTRNDVIHRAQLMQSNAETISKLERKYREYTAELCRRYP